MKDNSGSPQRIELWPEGAPGAVGNEESDRPYVTVHIPESDAPTAAVLICPGGAYGGLAYGHEGVDCAAFANGLGIAAFVLHYRVGPRYHHPAPMLDAQRAIRLIRHRSHEWNIAPHKIGIWGFSAGGHLASTAATHFDNGDQSAADPIDREHCRPDFLILGYAITALQPPYTHPGSRINLLGEHPDSELVEYLANDKHVTSDTPPTFLLHTDEDQAVASENSVLFYLALRRAEVPAEMHIFLKGRHGLGLAPDDPALSKWPDLLAGWLRSLGL